MSGKQSPYPAGFLALLQASGGLPEGEAQEPPLMSLLGTYKTDNVKDQGEVMHNTHKILFVLREAYSALVEDTGEKGVFGGVLLLKRQVSRL